MQDNLLQSFIEVAQTSKGYYKWVIRLFFPQNITPDEISNQLKKLDQSLKEKFPRNVAELKSSVSMKNFDTLD